MRSAPKPCAGSVAHAKPCKEPGCDLPKTAGRHRCRWHHLLTLDPEARVRDADARLKANEEKSEFAHRARVPEAEWPPGRRWCAGCQSFVPLFYTTGSRCKGCASRAAHGQHLKATYGISREDYEALWRLQGGRCAICHQTPGGQRRLAVDHDHRTDEIRGLLCASDQWGCNVQLRRLLNDEGMARRALAYVQRTPWQRHLAGETAPPRPSAQEDLRRRVLGASKPAQPPEEDWAGF